MDSKNSHGHLFDYFIVSGISQDDSSLLSLLPSESSEIGHCKASLLWRFPNERKENLWNSNIQDTLLQLCHPNGVLVSWNSNSNQPYFHSFLSTRDDGFRFYGHVLTYLDTVNQKTSNYAEGVKEHVMNIGANPLYVQKCICLISRFQYINTSEKILRALHHIFSSSAVDLNSLSVESYIYNILFEMSVPHPGQSLALKWSGEDTIVIQQPSTEELPLLDIHLSTVFKLLNGPGNVLKLLTSAFLEHQILLVSEDCHKLILVAEAITSLMFPFKWSHTYVPVLPFELARLFLDAPVPYIMGIPLRSSDEKLTHISSEFDQCFVDIDNATVDCPEDQPSFPDQDLLLEHLANIYMTFQSSKRTNAMDSLIEDSVSEEEESPKMKRRNAKKSKKNREGDKEKIADAVADDLSNLHAVTRPEVIDIKSLQSSQEDIEQDILNVKIREEIFGLLVSLLSQYDDFVILPELGEMDNHESWLYTRESQNFDKASFLSDQRELHLTFLSPFLETQAFAALIDGYILANLDIHSKGRALSLLDDRIMKVKSMPNPDKSPGPITKAKTFDQENALIRSQSIISAGRSAKKSVEVWKKTSESLIRRRRTSVNDRYPIVRPLISHKTEEALYSANVCFPNIIHPSLLLETVSEYIQDPFESFVPNKIPKRQHSVSEFTPEKIAHQNWLFLDKLLKDVKSKTNKLVVCKLGQDAYNLGHSHISLLGLEENTLIGSLCDLLERIWSHGLNLDQKRGKSALWSHLLSYEEDKSCVRIMSTPGIPPFFADRNISARAINVQDTVVRDAAHAEKNNELATRNERFIFPPVECNLISNIKRIRNLNEVRTNIGKCRAWIRLALEQKQLQAHLKKLLVNRPLLQTIYKRYSLLRCDDAREQFLYHLLALNTVDFSCFSNSFTKTVIHYHVWICPKKQLSGISQTTANVYMMISGESSCTDIIPVPKNCNEFSFSHRNLGVLTTVLFGHDNSGLLPRWQIDHVIIRNEFTGQAYFLPCGRWFGHAVEDGSTQRLLLAHKVPLNQDLNVFVHDVNCKTDLLQSTAVPKNISISQLRDCVGQCVNDIVQHLDKNFHNSSCAGILTSLLLKPNGLVALLTVVFENGLKSSGFFRKRFLAWDAIQTACDLMAGREIEQGDGTYKTALLNFVYNSPNSSPKRLPHGTKQLLGAPYSDARLEGDYLPHAGERGDVIPRDKRSTDLLLHVFKVVSVGSSHGLGKEDMFQLLICVGLKIHALSGWLKLMSLSLVRESSLYEKSAFMCDKEAIDSICGILNSLETYTINLEQIIWRRIDSLSKI